MNELFQLIYVEGNILATVCKVFILGFSFDMVLNICSLIGSSKDSVA